MPLPLQGVHISKDGTVVVGCVFEGKMKGAQLNESFTICELVRIWAEVSSNRYASLVAAAGICF